MKYLGIDYGEERIGLAASGLSGGLVFALATVQRKQYPGREEFFAAILKIIEQEGIEAIVVGLPLPLNPPTTSFEPSLSSTQPKPVSPPENMYANNDATLAATRKGRALPQAMEQAENYFFGRSDLPAKKAHTFLPDVTLEPLTCRRARNFAASLKRRCGLPVFLVNEALSSAEAAQRLKEAGLKGKKLLEALDSQAAVIILETFLNLPVERRSAI